MNEANSNRRYWDELADEYQRITRISTHDFHLGPLLPGGRELGLLPESLSGRHCLEIGCGAGQNSIFMARLGGDCVATDVSQQQLATGATLAAQAKVTVHFVQSAMERLPFAPASFDMVHSTFALPFTSEPVAVLQRIADLLAVGGTLILTTAHPVFAGEWLEVEDEGAGLFLTDYFRPPADTRFTTDDEILVSSAARPVGEIVNGLIDAGLRLQRLLEPLPLPIHSMSESEIKDRVPYDSDAWRELYEPLAHIPVVFTCVANKPR